MRFLAFLVIASVILSLARALTLVLILILAISLLWAVMTKPLEVFGFVALMLLSNVIAASPLASIIAITFIAVLVVLRAPSDPASASDMGGPEGRETGETGFLPTALDTGSDRPD